jgi:hypothetical protein
MQLQQIPFSVFKPTPPPLWYVTNGEQTVGPVVTGLLMRGVEAGRVPEYCHVRAYAGGWRKLQGVREIAALTSKVGSAPKSPSQQSLADFEPSVRLGIKDEDELCYNLTRLSLFFAGAESAMFHFVGRSSRALTTRCVLGPMSNERLGYTLPEHDLVLKSARAGRPVLGPPYGAAEDALAIRFASSKGGVGGAAMIPIFLDGKLHAMVELSRPGHAFRRADLQRAERIVQRALRQRMS